jgi:hypothetical protein
MPIGTSTYGLHRMDTVAVTTEREATTAARVGFGEAFKRGAVPADSNDSGTLSHPKYQPDIDGLRAIAVLAAVGFHVSPLWIAGGFVGVGIFFVISGFLISRIMDRACVHFSARLAISFWHRVLAIDKTCRSRRSLRR